MSSYHKLIASVLAITLHLPLLWSFSHGLQRGTNDSFETTGQAIVLKMASAPVTPPPVSPPVTPPAPPVEVTPPPIPKPAIEPPAVETNVADSQEAPQDASQTPPADIVEANPIIGKEGDSEGEQDDALSRYKALVRTHVERLREYPPQARLRRQEGTVEVAFSIGSNGAIENFRVISSSGSPLLDRSVERLFSRLRLPAPDEAIVPQLANLQLPVVFELQGI
ncbi:MAG: hypothetical protein CVV10_04950 [Gammaproteobacteria bacterium HGW-Gammaproteobacteria-14]|nr:MAG: hypothetical protein CVV10_04950 [Gammaproteobacteria bacterium HGW-Gammaproteobacteria-14]